MLLGSDLFLVLLRHAAAHFSNINEEVNEGDNHQDESSHQSLLRVIWTDPNDLEAQIGI